MMAHPLAAVWEEWQTDFLEESADVVTINYRPVRSGTDVTYDSFFNESTDPSDPTGIENIVEITPAPETVSGKMHLDLYGLSISSGEGDQQLDIGRFTESDALFSCLLSDVKTSTDSNPITTKFDNAYIVVPEKDGGRYEVIAVKARGMATAYVVDVYLKKTNKEDL
jgi:hypothetical protein